MNLNSWKQSGNIYLWHYEDNPRNYPGFHMTADASGCQSFKELLLLIDNAPPESTRTVKLAPPTEKHLAVPNARRTAKIFHKLRVSSSSLETEWSLQAEGEETFLKLSGKCIAELIQGLSDIEKGKGDYSIGNEGQELWFWWQLDR